MADAAPISAWRAALQGIVTLCPYCGEHRLIEKIAHGWLCNVCSKTWT